MSIMTHERMNIATDFITSLLKFLNVSLPTAVALLIMTPSLVIRWGALVATRKLQFSEPDSMPIHLQQTATKPVTDEI